MPTSVLLVEDDPLTNRINKEFIESTHFAEQLHICLNGWEAIEFLNKAITENQVPEIIFLDINMPVMDGWEFLNRYRTLLPKLTKPPLIFIQSALQAEDLSHIHQYREITGHITKPLNMAILKYIKERYFKDKV